MQTKKKDLFPRLLQKAKPQDKVDDILRLLQSEHERDHELVNDVIVGLKEISQSTPLSDGEGFRTSAEVFAASHLSHLNWENAVVLELARRRLDADDQRTMSQNMAKRRGITLPGL